MSAGKNAEVERPPATPRSEPAIHCFIPVTTLEFVKTVALLVATVRSVARAR